MSGAGPRQRVRIQDGDRQRLAEVYRLEYPRLVGLVALRTGDIAVAEEIVQDALVELCRNWDTVDEPARWLTRVALNLSNSWFRRRAAEARAYRRHGSQPCEEPAEPVGEIVGVRQAIATLPRKQQIVIALRFYEGMSVKETSELLGWPEGTVTSLTYRGVRTLRSTGLLSDERECTDA